MFDTGGNTKENKKNVREKEFNFLTLKPKKVGPYKKEIVYFNDNVKADVEINGTIYQVVKKTK